MGNRIFNNMASQMPVADANAMQGIQEAQKTQMQQAVKSLPTEAAPNASQVQAQAGGAAQAQGQAANQALQQTQQKTTQVAGLAQQKQAQDNQQVLFDRNMALQKKQAELQLKLGNMSEGLKQKLFDQQMDFKKDELGRTFFNERQLADWKISQAKSEEELATYEQQSREMHAKRMAVLKTSYAKLQQVMEQGFIDKEQTLDQNMKREMTQKMAALKKKIAEEQANASNTASMFGAAGTIIGGAVGSIGGPMGAMAGAAIGGGIGQMAGAAATRK